MLSQNGQVILKGNSHFQYQLKNPTGHIWCKVGDSSSKLSHGQATFPKILIKNSQIDLEDQGQWPPFSIPTGSIAWCMFVANLVILAQIYDDLSCGQAECHRILSQNGQMSMTPTFNSSWEYPMMHVWCKFSDSSSNMWGSIVRTWWSLRTDRRTDGQTQATTIPLRPEISTRKIGVLNYFNETQSKNVRYKDAGVKCTLSSIMFLVFLETIDH